MKKLVLLSLFAVSGAFTSINASKLGMVPDLSPEQVSKSKLNVTIDLKVRKNGEGEGFNTYKLAPYGMPLMSKFYIEALDEKTSGLQFTLEKVGTEKGEYLIKTVDGKILAAIPVEKTWKTQLYLYDKAEFGALSKDLGEEKALAHATWIVKPSGSLGMLYFIKNKGNSGFVGFQSTFTRHMALVTGCGGKPYTEEHFDGLKTVSNDEKGIMTRGLFVFMPAEKDEKKK